MKKILIVTFLLIVSSLKAQLYVIHPIEEKGITIVLDGLLFPDGNFSAFGKVSKEYYDHTKFSEYHNRYFVYEAYWYSEDELRFASEFSTIGETITIDYGEFIEVVATKEPKGTKIILEDENWIYSYGNGIYYFPSAETFFELHHIGNYIWYYEYNNRYWNRVQEW